LDVILEESDRIARREKILGLTVHNVLPFSAQVANQCNESRSDGKKLRIRRLIDRGSDPGAVAVHRQAGGLAADLDVAQPK
jgi:hypothetical protein